MSMYLRQTWNWLSRIYRSREKDASYSKERSENKSPLRKGLFVCAGTGHLRPGLLLLFDVPRYKRGVTRKVQHGSIGSI